MKRVGNLIGAVVAFDNLADAFHRAAKGKRGNPEVETFRASLGTGLGRLGEDLADGAMAFGPYRRFRVFDPKERWISVAPFRDRVAHHALMNLCEPVFDRYCIDDTYACRRGRGVHRAVKRAQHFSRRYPWFVKLDIRRYYDSVDHAVLFAFLCRRFRDRRVLELFRRLIGSYSISPGVGIPIGNLTSQHFANGYLGMLDHWIREERSVRGYVRYMDDFVVWAAERSELTALVREIRGFLHDSLRLDLKDAVLLNRSDLGIPFLGYRVFPDRVLLSRRSRTRFRRRLGICTAYEQSGLWSEAYAARRIEALTAWTAFADAEAFRRSVLDQIPAEPGSVSGPFKGSVHGLEPGDPRRQLEQQRQELPLRSAEQEQPDEPEPQHRVPACLARSSPPTPGAGCGADPDAVLSAETGLALRRRESDRSGAGRDLRRRPSPERPGEVLRHGVDRRDRRRPPVRRPPGPWRATTGPCVRTIPCRSEPGARSGFSSGSQKCCVDTAGREVKAPTGIAGRQATEDRR